MPGPKRTNLDVGELSQVGVHGAQTFVGEALVVVQPQGVRVLKHTGNRISIKLITLRYFRYFNVTSNDFLLHTTSYDRYNKATKALTSNLKCALLSCLHSSPYVKTDQLSIPVLYK